MKKITSTALLLLPAAALLAQTTAPFTLKGSVAKATGKEKAFLMYRASGNNITDSAVVTNGSFQFAGNIVNPLQATLAIAHNGETLTTLKRSRKVDITSLYLEKGNIALKTTDSVYNAVITGGQVNQDYQQLTAAMKPFQAKTKAVEAEENAVPKDKQTPELQAEYEKRYNAIEAEQKVATGVFIKAHPKSWVSLNSLQSYGGYYPEASDLEPMFNQLSPELKSSEQGQYYAKLIPKLKLIAIGAQAPVFAQNDKDGKSISIDSFKGKYLLIDFWASWCGPCRRENPNVVKAYNQFKNSNFTILGVSLDQPTGREKWLKAIEDDGLVWTQVTDLKYWNNEAAALYGVRAIPQNFLLDPQGKIIAKNLEGKELTNKLTQLLGSKGGAAPAGETMNK